MWLLVCSDYGIMATSSPIVPGASVEPVKLPVVSLMVAVVVGIVVATAGVSGVVYLLARSGHLPMPAARLRSPSRVDRAQRAR